MVPTLRRAAPAGLPVDFVARDISSELVVTCNLLTIGVSAPSSFPRLRRFRAFAVYRFQQAGERRASQLVAMLAGPSTDVEVLVTLGYTREIACTALATCEGDRAAALELIRTGDNEASGRGQWMKAEESDWLRGIGASTLPKDRAMRALWRTPVSVHVVSHAYGGGDPLPLFRCKVITQTAHWQMYKTYKQFSALKQALPFGTTFWFRSNFPQPPLLSFLAMWGRGNGGDSSSSSSSSGDPGRRPPH